MPAAYSRSESCDVLVPVCSLNCSTECKEVRELQSCRVVAIWLRRCHFTRTPWSPESVFNYQPSSKPTTSLTPHLYPLPLIFPTTNHEPFISLLCRDYYLLCPSLHYYGRIVSVILLLCAAYSAKKHVFNVGAHSCVELL